MATTKLLTVEDLVDMMGYDVPYELIQGVLRDVSPSSFAPSVIAGRIFGRLFAHVDGHDLGFVTNAEGGFILARDPDTMVAPDVGFIRADRLPRGIAFDGFCPVPPDFAVEVMSPSDRPRAVQEKINLYLESGVPLVWWVRPRQTIVAVYRPGRPVEEFGKGDVLDGEPVLPGFQLAVSDIFK